MPIDTAFDFTSDSPGYWDGFWERRQGLGLGGCDPDSASPTLRRYHCELWSRELPCGRRMELRDAGTCMQWDGRRFSSDSIAASFRYLRNRELLEEVAASMDDYRGFVESFLHSTYTIGGMMIFPRRNGGMNQTRGSMPCISDRWDLTLECIRRHYAGEENPLEECMCQDQWFYDLFVDFRGFVEFFLLQDCVTRDHREVRICGDWSGFDDDPMPKGVEEYLDWINGQLEFVRKRNELIRYLIEKQSN